MKSIMKPKDWTKPSCIISAIWLKVTQGSLDLVVVYSHLLAPTAATQTQKNLSSEDTDVLEVTLGALSALDKLLHLMRQRNNELKLLSARIKSVHSALKTEKYPLK